MPLPLKTEIESFTDIQDRARANLNLKSEDEAGIETVPKVSLLDIISGAVAGAIQDYIYKSVAYIYRQLWPWSMDDQNVIRSAAVDGVELKQASFASKTVPLTGIPDSVFRATDTEPARLRRGDGFEYIARDSAQLDATGSATLSIEAATPGARGNCPAGTELQLSSPQAGIDSTIIVAQSIENGFEAESVDDLRERWMKRRRSRPAGGSKSDFEVWALEVAGVKRAWCIPRKNGLGTVGVVIAGEGNGKALAPPPETIAEVHAHLRAVGPVQARDHIEVRGPDMLPVDIEVAVQPDTPENRAEIEKALCEYFARQELRGEVLPPDLSDTVRWVAGVVVGAVRSPVAPIQAGDTELLTLGVVTYV